MKLKFDRSARIKILLVVAVVLMAPWFAPFAIDFIILADFMGLEALLVFLFASSRSGMTVPVPCWLSSPVPFYWPVRCGSPP